MQMINQNECFNFCYGTRIQDHEQNFAWSLLQRPKTGGNAEATVILQQDRSKTFHSGCCGDLKLKEMDKQP